nr:hypothetical protein Hi04_10k_c3807_00003 [uncultured bacterium]
MAGGVPSATSGTSGVGLAVGVSRQELLEQKVSTEEGQAGDLAELNQLLMGNGARAGYLARREAENKLTPDEEKEWKRLSKKLGGDLQAQIAGDPRLQPPNIPAFWGRNQELQRQSAQDLGFRPPQSRGSALVDRWARNYYTFTRQVAENLDKHK